MTERTVGIGLSLDLLVTYGGGSRGQVFTIRLSNDRQATHLPVSELCLFGAIE